MDTKERIFSLPVSGELTVSVLDIKGKLRLRIHTSLENPPQKDLLSIDPRLKYHLSFPTPKQLKLKRRMVNINLWNFLFHLIQRSQT